MEGTELEKNGYIKIKEKTRANEKKDKVKNKKEIKVV